MLKLLELIGIPQQFTKLTFAGIIALLIGLFLLLGKCAIDKHDKKTFNAGVTNTVVQSQSETLNAVQQAHDVVTRPSDAELNSLCDTYDRNCPRARSVPSH